MPTPLPAEDPAAIQRRRRTRERLLPPVAEACPVRDVLAHVGGKWAVLAMFGLSAGPLRFGELRRQLPGISQRMLSQTLRTLQRDGLVFRRVKATSPPGVDYRLTPLGQSILVPLRHVLDWANANFPAIRAAREAFLADPPADEG